MAAGLIMAMTVPGVVLLLVVLAVAEKLASKKARPGVVSRQTRSQLSAGAFGAYSAAVSPGPAIHQEQQRTERLLRDYQTDREPWRLRIGNAQPPDGSIVE